MRLRMFNSRLRRLPGGGGTALVVTGALLSTFLGTVVAGPAVAAPAKARAKAVSARPDAVAAMMAARTQHSRVEVLADRTDASQTFANPDGSFSYSVSAQPRRVKRGRSWQSLDATLTWSDAHTVVPARSESPLVLSGGGSGPLATMTVDGRKLSISWPTPLPKPRISGATATYADVLPSGVDLEVTATPAGGVEETLIVKNAKAAADPALANLTLATATSGRTKLSADAGGNLTFKDSHGRALITSPAPVMWDSSTTAPTTPVHGGTRAAAPESTSASSKVSSSIRGPGARARVARVRVGLAGHRLALTPDRALLRGRTTTYPVFIDPAYVPHPASGSTLQYDEVQQAYPTVSNYDAAPGSGLAVGYQGFSSPTGIERTFYNLSIPSAIYGAHIVSAKLNTTVTYAAASGSNSTTVGAFSTGSISSSTTWNTQPAKATGASNPNYPSANGSATFTTTSSSPNLPVSFNVTSGMQYIANIDLNHWTLGLYNATETNDVDLVRFAANPTFSITYNNPPATPSSLSISPSNAVGSTTYTSTGTPTLSSSATDANSDTVQLDYQILSGTTVKASGNTAFVTAGTAATWKPTTALADGAYTWQVRAYDGADYSAWTTAKSFTIDTITPPAPSISCPGYPAGTWTAAVSGGVTCTLTDTATDTYAYTWGLDNDPGNWVTGTSPTITITPSAGFHTLWARDHNNANTAGPAGNYSFGVGSAGMTAPDDQATTSTTFPLKATAPPGSTKVTFQYRKGTSGAFTTIPAGDVTNGSSSVTWPVNVTAGSSDVQSPALTWNVTRTLNDDGLLQTEAVFTDSSGNNPATTPPVNVTLDRVGTGADFGTTEVGPVTIGLQSGNASITASDVAIASFGSGLGVTRTFNSLAPAASSVFGPGWTTSLPVAGTSATWSSITSSTSYATLTGADGSKLTFATIGTDGNGLTTYSAQGPAVTAGLTLTKKSGAFTLADTTGVVTTFTTPAGGAPGTYLPAVVTQAGGDNTGYVYDAVSSDSAYGKPILVVAPDADAPVGTSPTSSCPNPPAAATWDAGCRALKLSYDATTGNVSEIDFVSSDGSTLTQTPVADYTYDSTGRLKYEWDPRVSTPLKSMYLYDEAASDSDYGRITAVYPAQDRGQPSNVLQPWTLAYDYTPGDADFGKVVSVTRTHDAAHGSGTAKNVIAYSVPLTTAAGGPLDMDPATTATWGQQDTPVSAVAIFPPDHAPTSSPPSDWTYAQILYYDASGRQVNEAGYDNGWNVSTTEYDQYGNDIRELSAGNRATALAAGSTSAAVAGQLDTESRYTADGSELLDTYGPAHQAMAAGTLQTVRTHTHDVYDQDAPNGDKDANGNPYQLKTSETVTAGLGAGAPGSSDVDARTTQYLYSNGTDTTGWTLRTPLQTVTDPGTGHLGITSTTVYNENSSLYGGEFLPVETRLPGNTSGGGAGTTRTVYYTAGSNSADSDCGGKPAWADLVCKTEPAAQPNTSGLASLPVTTYTYNVYLQPLTRTETYTAADGTGATRTTTTTYDAAGRTTRSTVSTTGPGMGSAVAPAKTVYSSTTGLPIDLQSLDASGNATADLATSYDDFGDPSSYADANGRVTDYTYDLAERVVSRSDGSDTTTYGYNGGTVHDGSLTSETDAHAGTFGAGYDPDGNLVTETYPGGTTATYTFDATGTATSLAYTNSDWAGALTDSVQTNDAGDWTNRTELSTTKTYSYDAADRLSAVADTQSGQCTTRAYGYDADSNRTNLTTSAPNPDGTCQTSTSTTENHTYDAADRITDAGFTYDTLGDITTTPSVDAGGSGALTAGFYANGMLASQAQAGGTSSWTLDPTGTRASTTTVASSGITFTNDYANQSDKPDLITASNGAWSRNVLGPNDHLAATVTASGVSLQLMDLHGDLMATEDVASDSVTSTSTYTEFGLVEAGPTASYGWTAGAQREGTGQAGQILMGVRGYNPYLGRFDQRDPVPGGSANAYDFAYQNPVGNSDVSGAFTFPHGHVTCGYATCTFYLSHWGSNHLYNLMADWGWTTAAVSAAVGALLGLVMCEGSAYCAWAIGTYFGVMAALIIDAADRAHNHHICFAMKTTFPTWTTIGYMFVPLYPEAVGGRNCW
ncbi:RHS repeat-associated core domain-containing protein [Streptomyces sp. NPDC048751]|uniref:RHS repeat domain-containing protein n=1 Tax=Streptomyces sp. NPDC048751 TaxID=3365591 RepID=UPI00372012BE